MTHGGKREGAGRKPRKEKVMEDRLIKHIDLWDIFECNSIDEAIEALQKLKARYEKEYSLHFNVELDDSENGKVVYLIGEKK